MTSSDHLLVLYASQTGNAEWIAKNIDDQAKERGFESRCLSMDAASEEMSETLPNEPVLIFVASTTGDGDAPDNALKFWRWVRKASKVPTAFKQTKFTVLGLGDTNYSNFGAHPRRIEKKLQEFGGTVFYPKAIADEVETIEATVDPWIAGLWAALETVCTPVRKPTAKVDKNPVTGVEAEHHQQPNVEMKLTDIAAQLALTKIQEAHDAETDQLMGHRIPLEWELLDQFGELTGLPRSALNPSKIEWTGNAKLAQYELKYFESTTDKDAEFDARHPSVAKLTRTACLTTSDAYKRTLFLEMYISEMKWSFEPGDAVGILCPNEERLVRAVIQRLRLDPAKEFKLLPAEGHTNEQLPSHIRTTQSVYELFTHQVDLKNPPRKAAYRLLADHCSDVKDKKMLLLLCSKQGAQLLKKYQSFEPTFLDFLTTFESCQPPLNVVIDCLLPLTPRYYSICNSPLESGKEKGSQTTKIQVAFNVVRYTTPEPVSAERLGVCTHWLDVITGQVPSRQTGTSQIQWHSVDKPVLIPVFPRPSKEFHLPTNTETPVIFIGPGTGVAPFLGFLQHRHLQKQQNPSVQLGEAWLFFGCRHQSRDYLFESDLNFYKEQHVLNQLIVCFSRDTPQSSKETTDTTTAHPKYVQDNLVIYGKQMMDLMLNQNAIIYVCGDARGMAQDVHQTLIQLLQPHCNQDKMQAIQLIQQWQTSGRYLRDIWA